MFLVQGFKEKKDPDGNCEGELRLVFQIKNRERDEALTNMGFVFATGRFDQVTMTPEGF